MIYCISKVSIISDMDDDCVTMDRDPGGRIAHLDDFLHDGGPDSMAAAAAEATFNQERSLVAKLLREELEDRYLRLLEENIVIKKHAFKQVSKGFAENVNMIYFLNYPNEWNILNFLLEVKDFKIWKLLH